MTPSLLLQRLLPLHWLTRCAGRLAASRRAWIAQPLIQTYARRYRVDLAEAALADPRAYESFNAFFARALRPGARPLANADWTSPADGTVSQLGRLRRGRLIQAKQRPYSAAALLGDAALARQLEGGLFTTIYLSPRDYHRVHMPCAGRLLGMRYVPGTLYSVRPEIVQGIDGLLARNQRLVCWFEHPRHGVYAMVLVGAAIVGGIAAAWHGRIAPAGGPIRLWTYPDEASAPTLPQGAEMGHFELGSTVVMLMPPGAWRFHPDWTAGGAVRMGQALTRCREQAL